MARSVWMVLGLCAGAIVLYAIAAPQPAELPGIEVRGSRPPILKYGAGDVVPMEIAASVPEESVQSFSPEGEEVSLPRREKEREALRKRLYLPEPDRARFIKRGKEEEDDRHLKYRFRVEKGWELYRVPDEVRQTFLDTATAMTAARSAGGQEVSTPSGRSGFELTHIDPGSILEEAGLRPGDVIISVNNRPVRGEEDGRRLYAELKHEREFLVVVEREGEIVNLHYELDGKQE